MRFTYSVRTLFVLNMVYLGWIGEWLKFGIVLSAFLVLFIPDMIERWFHIQLTQLMKHFFVSFIVLSQWCGTYLRAYDYISWWDLFLHGLSAVLVALGGIIILKLLDPKFVLFEKKLYGLISWFIFFVVSASAVFWEIFEFTGDTFFGTFSQLGSLSDTMEDMIICVVVGAVLSTYIWWSLKREKDNWMTRQLVEFRKINTKKKALSC